MSNEKYNSSCRKDLTKRIQYLAGENPAQFARDAKIRDQTFRKYLNGSMPGPIKIIKIAEAGNVSTGWLLTGHEPKSNPPPNGYTTEGIQNLKDLAAANKKLNDHLEQENKELKRKVKNLTEEFQKFIKKYTEYRRRGDPEDLDVGALRKYPNGVLD